MSIGFRGASYAPYTRQISPPPQPVSMDDPKDKLVGSASKKATGIFCDCFAKTPEKIELKTYGATK